MTEQTEIVLKGIAASPGVAIGPAYILDKNEVVVPPRGILEKEVPIEIARFEEALIRTREEIADLKKKIEEELGGQHAQIFDAHLLVLEDTDLREEVIKRIKNEKQSAEYVFSDVLKKYIRAFSTMPDEYLRERTQDIEDVGRRVLRHLLEEDRWREIDHLNEPVIIIAHDLSPSDTVGLVHKQVLGFATDIGGRTSHTAIMAKSLGIPAVVGLKDATLRIANQDEVIIDGSRGLVFVHPTQETRESYLQEQQRFIEFRSRFEDIKDQPAQTLDGRQVKIMVNLELPEEIPLVISKGADGVGLYRTEYFYMNRSDLPTEEEQYEAYRQVVEALAPRSVTIRTLDLGGDKFISSLQIPKDMYPFLGWRALKFCLTRPDIFKTQLRAILRAGAHGNARLMYPMVSGPAELERANEILESVKRELKEEGVTFDEDMPVGVMIEVPSAAMTADLLAKKAAFFSIGTNDLVQYTLAVDRVNEQTAEFYEPCHPGVLRLIKTTIDAGHREGIPVGLCGEMAGEPGLALLLLGMGLDEFSMSAVNVPQIKKLIRHVRYDQTAALAAEMLALEDGRQIEAVCRRRLQEWLPDLFGREMEVMF